MTSEMHKKKFFIPAEKKLHQKNGRMHFILLKLQQCFHYDNEKDDKSYALNNSLPSRSTMTCHFFNNCVLFKRMKYKIKEGSTVHCLS